MSEPETRNRRRKEPVHAEASPRESEPSPLPGAISSSVRPPAKKRAGRAAATMQMIAGGALVVACSVGVAWGARRYVLSSPRFAVKTVLVDGTVRRTAEEVAERGGVVVGSNVFALDLDAVKESLSRDPWVERATVTRKLPGTIRIEVVEREARAIVAIGAELYLATADGDLFKKIEPADPYDLPIVTGLSPESVAADREGAALTVRRLLDAVTELERAGLAKRYPVQELHVEKDGALVVTIGKDAIALHLGQAPYRGKIAQATRVIAEVAARKAQPSVVFLDNDAHPERVVVRMR